MPSGEFIPGRIYVKSGAVHLHDATPELLGAVSLCGAVFRSFGYWMVVTSLNDGQHRKGSHHYTGQAADLRTHNVPRMNLEELYGALREKLGPAWRVLLESKGLPNEHFHIEPMPENLERSA